MYNQVENHLVNTQFAPGTLILLFKLYENHMRLICFFHFGDKKNIAQRNYVMSLIIQKKVALFGFLIMGCLLLEPFSRRVG